MRYMSRTSIGFALGTVVFASAVQLPSAAQTAPPASASSTKLLPTYAQRQGAETFSRESFMTQRARDEMIHRRFQTEQELEQVAIIDRSVMIPMRDGKKMLADIYIPKSASRKPVPTILSRTPYDFNYWDVELGAPADMSEALEAVQHGYAFALIQERGHTFSQGEYEILGAPVTDGYDEIKWLTSQPWSDGKLAPTGCSSTAEWQSAVVAMNPPGLETFNPRAFGAGVGRVGPYYEQGNWFQGGAVRLLFVGWIFDQQNTIRPMFPDDTTQQQLTEARKLFNLEPAMPPLNWNKEYWHLPVSDMIRAVGGPAGIFDTPEPGTPTGGNMIARLPNSPEWYKGGLWNDSESITKPGLWFMSWFDVSVSPNLAEYNFVRKHAPAAIADQQYLVIAPGLHCQYIDARRSGADYKVGDLDEGDARYPYTQYMYDWFDHFLKGQDNGVLKQHPRVMYYLLGKNEWKDSPSWPPPGSEPRTYYLASGGSANTMYGDGSLASAPPAQDAPDRYAYDPANPAPTVGEGGCCLRGVPLGSFDQREVETRNDVLVYTTPPFKQGMEVSGPVTLTLYVSSDRKDTDFTFKLIDVHPDGKAFNLTENIQRARWRNGYDRAPAWMQPGQVYKVTFQPVDISNYFAPGHSLRVSVSSSDFPYFDRNLNTGLNNQTTSEMLIAHNQIHHSAAYPSEITLTVLPASKQRPTDPYHHK